ncbi:MAG: AAA family ATPase [Acidiferrobacterales bacterium]
MPQSPERQSAATSATVEAVLGQVSQVVLGKEQQIRLALACLLARGHLLIEDLPGVGKTTLAHVLAHALGLNFSRIQFTSDLLPADILGVSVYQTETRDFRFHPGPIFAQLVLADEINRATPKTQSALLEAMEERQVTADGMTQKLPNPFFVIATQNPLHLIGTFPLPESQLDRFLMRIEMGYPDRKAERALLKGRDRRELLDTLTPVIADGEFSSLQQRVSRIHCSDALLDYVQDLLEATRASTQFANGLSPRAGLAVVHSARAWALLEGRDMVLPEDVQAVAPSVIAHRLRPAEGGDAEPFETKINDLLESVPIP